MTTSAARIKLGERIRDLRIKKGLTQEGLAAMINFDRSYMGFIERGERNLSFDVIVKLSTALDIKPDELLKDIK